jgi:hypothetical protein
MDLVLRERLPLELVEIIMEYVWVLNMKDTHYSIKNNLVWIHAHQSYTFIISENKNYYEPLFWNIPTPLPIKNKNKKKNRNYEYINFYYDEGIPDLAT